MNYAAIKEYDVANGPGVRVSLFVSGCSHHCKDCFNQETWDFNFGEPFTKETEDKILLAMKPDYIKGITLLGGDPFERVNQRGLLPLVKEIRARYPQKTIWCFTGYDFEKDIMNGLMKDWPETKELVSYLDVLVDGEFMLEKKDLNLQFRGSSNQRLIQVQETLKTGKIVLWKEAEAK